MIEGPDRELAGTASDERLSQALEWFLRVRSEGANAEDLAELRRWMESDRQNTSAYQQISATWTIVGAHASAPEIMIGRRDALEDSRRAARSRWSAVPVSRFRWVLAASVLLAAIAISAWFVTQRGDVYATDLGERRTVTLGDGSVVTLDAQSRVRVKFTEKERALVLEEGQARFTVAKDPLRPFRVQARDQTVVALGTQFDIELVSGGVLVTLIEGHVAVAGVDPRSISQVGSASQGEVKQGLTSPQRTRHLDARTTDSGGGAETLELRPGQALTIRQDGRAVLVANVDLDRATAWQSGKLFFDDEPLASAAERINRYAHRPIVIDPSVAQVGISGVFNAGDADAFVEAVTSYFPVQVDGNNESEVRLTARK